MKHLYLSQFTPFLPSGTLRFATFCLLFIGFVFPQSAEAKHIIGGEMTYRFVQDLGGGMHEYEFTLVVYRDCDANGAVLDNPVSIGIFRGGLLSAVMEADTQIFTSDIEFVDPVIPPCADASQVSNACVERGVYVFTLILPVLLNESYLVVYQRCCRTDQIANIVAPDSYGATYMVELTPEAQASGNSSPTFNNYPPTFICNNLPIDFDHGAMDVDGDSLVYEFCTPLHGGGQGGSNCESPQPSPPCPPPFANVEFTTTFSQNEPMGGNPVVTIDSLSGLLTGVPHLLGQFVVGICVKEYRNGVLIGSILRDFQFNVVDCTSTVVADMQADEILGPKQFLIKRCGEKVITIINQSPLSPDLAAWEWEIDFGNGNIFTAGTWNLTVAIPDFGEYQGRLFLNRGNNSDCRDSASFILRAFPGVVADFGDSWDLCVETPVAFSDSSVSGATGGILTWAWTFGAQVPPTSVPSPVITFPAYGTYPVKLVVTDSDGCKDEISQMVLWEPQIPPVIPPLSRFRVCLPAEAQFTLLDSLGLDVDDHIVWDFGDGQVAKDILSPSHLYKPGFYTVSVAITTPFGCFSTDTFSNVVEVYTSPVADFSYLPDMPSNLDNTVLFINESDSTAVFWSWQFGNFGTSQQNDPLFTFPDTGLVPIILSVTNASGCPDTMLRVIDIVPKVQLYIPNAFAPQSSSGLGNELFGMLGILPGYTDFRMNIWSRWGELLFETNNPDEGWDGRRAGNKSVMPKGVYIYSIRFTGPRGEPFRFDGSITLL